MWGGGGRGAYPSNDPLEMSLSDRPSAYTKLVTVRALGTTFLLPPLVAGLSSPCAPSMTVTGVWDVTPRSVFSAMRRSQTRMLPSRPPVLSRLGCWGSHAMVFTVLVCPRRRCSVLPVGTSVMRAVWSPEQVAKEASSGDHRRSNIPLSWISRSTRFATADEGCVRTWLGLGVRTGMTDLSPTRLASRCPRCTRCPVQLQRPDGLRRRVSQLILVVIHGALSSKGRDVPLVYAQA